ncbi:hypothetical protein HanPSC8_Chr01g0011301 [Helianthus annuus]|nr:hypothetical protein HanPSC8_Chr01g0011301 [Helianthus annuus]
MLCLLCPPKRELLVLLVPIAANVVETSVPVSHAGEPLPPLPPSPISGTADVARDRVRRWCRLLNQRL